MTFISECQYDSLDFSLASEVSKIGIHYISLGKKKI